MRALDNGAHADHYCDYTWLQNKTKETQQGFFCRNTELYAEVQGSLVNVTWPTNCCTERLKLGLMMLSEFIGGSMMLSFEVFHFDCWWSITRKWNDPNNLCKYMYVYIHAR